MLCDHQGDPLWHSFINTVMSSDNKIWRQISFLWRERRRLEVGADPGAASTERVAERRRVDRAVPPLLVVLAGKSEFAGRRVRAGAFLLLRPSTAAAHLSITARTHTRTRLSCIAAHHFLPRPSAAAPACSVVTRTSCVDESRVCLCSHHAAFVEGLSRPRCYDRLPDLPGWNRGGLIRALSRSPRCHGLAFPPSPRRWPASHMTL